MMRKIILVSGYANSGKSLLAEYLVKNKNFVEFSIANELKKHTAEKFGFPHYLTLSQDGKRTIISQEDKSIRELLIEEAYRQKSIFGDNVFISNVIDKIKHMDFLDKIVREKKELKNVVISDFRYQNEYKYICENLMANNSTLFLTTEEFNDHAPPYNIHRPNTNISTIRINRFFESPVKDISETQLDRFPFKHFIDNYGSIEEFYTKIDQFLEKKN